MTSDEARGFAAQWTDAWNGHNIERVLAHFHDEVEFTSPTALAAMGCSKRAGQGRPSRVLDDGPDANAAGQVVVAEVFHGVAW